LAETPPTFRALYEGHFDFVWRFAANRGVPSAALDEVVREVFLIVYQQQASVEARLAFKTWVAGVTRSVVRSYLRSHGHQSPPPLAAEALYTADDLGPPELLERKTAGELLDLILEKMSAAQREAFVLCDIEGLAPIETAQALGVTETTLRARLHQARAVFNAFSARLRAQRFWIARQGGNLP
jgi:RNA polymerase sigma-70 factor (ECF subfamily)